jgi:hypothetical protein
VSLDEELRRAAGAAAAFAERDERLEAVLAAEPASGQRVYLCAYAGGAGRTWLALDDAGQRVASRGLVREAVSIAALCELADEFTGQETAPRLATPAYLDELAGAHPELGRALGGSFDTVESLTQEVEAAYKGALS